MVSNGQFSYIPSDLVFDLKSNGLSNNQVVEELQRMGYGVDKIFDAVRLGEDHHANPGVAMNAENFNTNMPPPPMLPQQSVPNYGQSFQQPMPSMSFSGGIGREDVEEIAETIIQEKWTDLVEDVKKVVSWKEEVETQMTKIEQQIKNIKENFSSLQKAIFGKINDYDKSISDVGTEIKAMEKVFQKVLPDLTSNVNELSGIVRRMKK